MEANKRTIAFLKSRFGEYYKKCDLYLPERFGKREFGFMYFGSDMMQRHLRFKTKDNIRKFLVDKVPMHVFHSSAYYEKPDAPTMEEKGWLGADLIFDLDADHLKNAKELSYENMLAEVKKEFIKLLENYILDDFGFSKKHLTVVFSGARGYHLHVRDPKILGMGSPERREIMDYISGPGTEDIERFVFAKEAYDRKEYRDKERRIRTSAKFIRKMPKISDFGWRKKMRMGVENLLKELREMGKENAIKFLARLRLEGVGKATSQGIWNDLFEGKTKGADRMLAEDNLEVFSSNKLRDTFIKIVEDTQKVKLVGEADEPVTSDTKRLIRLPTSLHGKTGFVVKRIGFDELEGFNPLTDAIPSSFGLDRTKIKMKKPIKLVLRGEKFNLSRGIYRVPEYAAIFLMCRGLAVVV